jgi:Icc-related predicted phosphoesterase
MRIYAVADIHGKLENIARIKQVIMGQTPDVLVIAGDIGGLFVRIKTRDLFKEFSIPVLYVLGNSDLKHRLFDARQNAKRLSPEPLTFLSSRFIGLSGTIPLPFVSKIALREKRLLRSLKTRITPETILVVHPPPRGILDKVGSRFCAGSSGLRQLIENHPPLMVLCGHIHEQAGYQYLNHTLVVNCAMNKTSRGALIDCRRDKSLTIKMI